MGSQRRGDPHPEVPLSTDKSPYYTTIRLPSLNLSLTSRPWQSPVRSTAVTRKETFGPRVYTGSRPGSSFRRSPNKNGRPCGAISLTGGKLCEWVLPVSTARWRDSPNNSRSLNNAWTSRKLSDRCVWGSIVLFFVVCFIRTLSVGFMRIFSEL